MFKRLILAAVLRSNYRRKMIETGMKAIIGFIKTARYPSLDFKREVSKGSNTKPNNYQRIFITMWLNEVIRNEETVDNEKRGPGIASGVCQTLRLRDTEYLAKPTVKEHS